MPWEAVFGPIKGVLSRRRRFAIAVALGELDGGEFDWSMMYWKPRR